MLPLVPRCLTRAPSLPHRPSIRAAAASLLPCLICVASVLAEGEAHAQTAAKIAKGPYLQGLTSTSVEIRAELEAPAPVAIAITPAPGSGADGAPAPAV